MGKAGSANRDQDVPKLLSELAETWDQDKATSLFWDRLNHQGTCYGATYAAIPHLLKIAEPDENWRQRFEIALFLGYVTLCTLEHAQESSLPGLPETLDGWDRKLDCYRTLITRFEDPDEHSSDYDQTELLPRFRKLLAIEPVNAADPENRLYFDDKSGECRRNPPHGNFAWFRTRSYHWCGDWRSRSERVTSWQRLSTHPKDERPVLLYKKDTFCRQSGMMVGYWNNAFGKWHDDGDRLFEYNEFTGWMDLPEPPDGQ